MWFADIEKEPVGVVGQIIPWNFPLLMQVGSSRKPSGLDGIGTALPHTLPLASIATSHGSPKPPRLTEELTQAS